MILDNAITHDVKSATALRTITEVADTLRVPAHVLRFWETKFKNLKPVKRAGGRRYYRTHDVVLLERIRDLLYVQGFTIRGVQKILHDTRGFLPNASADHPQADNQTDNNPQQNTTIEGFDDVCTTLEMARESSEESGEMNKRRLPVRVPNKIAAGVEDDPSTPRPSSHETLVHILTHLRHMRRIVSVLQDDDTLQSKITL